MAFVFDKCCCCIELRTGCLILAYLQLVFTILGIFGGIAQAVVGGKVANDLQEEAKKNSEFPASKANINEEDAAAVSAVLYVLAILMIIMVVLFIVNLAFQIVLLVGLHKNKRGHIKVYLIFSTICLVIYILMFLGSLSKVAAAGNIMGGLIGIAFSIYILLVFRSHYIKLGDDSTKPAVFRTA